MNNGIIDEKELNGCLEDMMYQGLLVKVKDPETGKDGYQITDKGIKVLENGSDDE